MGYILILFRNKSSNSSNFSDLPSNTGSEAVSAFGIGSRLADGNVCGCGANRMFDVVGRSFDWSLGTRCFGLLVGWFVVSLRTPVTMLRLLFGVILELVALVLPLIGVEVAFSGLFSESESESSVDLNTVCFLTVGAISFSVSFWFSAEILVRSDMISFLSTDFIFSKLSVVTLGDLLVPTIGFSPVVFSGRGVSISVEISSSAAFLFWLLVVIFQSSRTRSSENI